MARMNRRMAKLAFIALATLPLAAAPAAAETMDELYAKAKAEGAMSLWAAGPTAPHEGHAKAFEQRFPGIKVSITGGFSNVLNSRINKQLTDGKVEADLVIFQTIQDFVGWKKQGVLLNFKPEGFDQIYPEFRDPDGAFVAVAVNPIVYAYNTKALRPDETAEIGARFPQPAVHRQGHHGLPVGRRRCALPVPHHRDEVRLELHGQVHGQQAELHPGPSAGRAQRGERREHRDFRRHLDAMAAQARRPADRRLFLAGATRRRCSP